MGVTRAYDFPAQADGCGQAADNHARSRTDPDYHGTPVPEEQQMLIEVYIAATSRGPVEPYQPQPVAAPGNV